MSTQLYTLCEVYIDGSKLTEETSVKLTVTSKAQVVETVARGFAGLSPGAKMISISIENAAPSATFEYDPSLAVSELRVVELTLFAAGKTLTSKGFLTDYEFGHSVNSPSSLSMSFTGEYAAWE